MARLDGTSNLIDLEPGYRLCAPGLVGNADIRDGRASATRGGGIELASEAFNAALEATGIHEIRSINLAVQQQPLPPQAATTRTAGGEEGMVLEVPDLGETVGQIPLAFSMPEKNQFCRHVSPQ